MNSFLGRFASLFSLVAAALVVSSCNSDKGGAGSSDPLTTNFSVNLSTLIDSLGGKPDSIVAEIRIDGGAVDRLVIDPSKISESGVVRFPVEATEGSKVDLVYKVWSGEGVVGAGSVKWVSGESFSVPRPNLAPSVVLETGRGGILFVRRNTEVWIHATTRDAEGALAALLVDWNGDGAMDDSLVPPKGRDSLRVSWGAAGTYRVVAWVQDASGLRRRDTMSVRVLPAATIVLSKDETGSILDSVAVDAAVSFDDPDQAKGTRLVWRGHRSLPETTSVVPRRLFSWATAGTRAIEVSTIDTLGEIDRDTIVLDILQDAPVVDLSLFPSLVDPGVVTLLPLGVSQRFGSIVRWGIDFDGDTSLAWDSVSSQPAPAGVSHLFPASGSFVVRVFVEDDDGNRVVAFRQVQVSSSTNAQVLRRVSPQDTVVSIHDSVDIRFVRNFPPGVEAGSRIEWKVDGAPIVSEPVAVRRTFAWSANGIHTVAWRVVTSGGATFWDTIRVDVRQDVPVIDLGDFPDTAGLNASTNLRARATQSFGTFRSWKMDFDGDTTSGWDRSGLGSLPPQVQFSFPVVGDPKVLVRVEDDDGNVAVASRIVPVRDGNFGIVQRLSARDTSVSIRDTVAVRLQYNFADPSQQSKARLVWRVDASGPETLAVASMRLFVWSEPGRHVMRFRVIGDFGATSWDSVVVQVVQGVPRILAIRRVGNGVGKDIAFSAQVDPGFGAIVTTRWNFGDDETWEDTLVDPATQVTRSFGTSAPVSIRLEVRDDDGNVADTLFTFAPSNAPPRFSVVSFAEASVGIQLDALLKVSFSDPDGNDDLLRISLDWEGDGTWDTVRNVAGLGSDEIRHRWATPGTKTIRLLLQDRSGDTASGSATIQVASDAPDIQGLEADRAAYRIGDPIVLTARILDPSAVSDYSRIRWDLEADGRFDTSVDLRGRLGAITTSMTLSAAKAGPRRVCVLVEDLVGNQDSGCVTVDVRALPPRILARLNDTVPTATDTTTLLIDSLQARSLEGVQSRVVAVHWMPMGGAWTEATPTEVSLRRIRINLPAQTAGWYVVVRATQDNGEVAYDTARGRILPVFVDSRDGRKYPVVTIGTQKWLGRNLDWNATLSTVGIQSWCHEQDPTCERYGRFYASGGRSSGERRVEDKFFVQGVCPEGWHVPTRSEWQTLERHVRTVLPMSPVGVALRARSGWSVPHPRQTDPLDFRAVGVGDVAAFWQSEDTTSDLVLSSNIFATGPDWNLNSVLGKDGLTGGTSAGVNMRCLANDRLHIDETVVPSFQADVSIGSAIRFVYTGIPVDPVSLVTRTVRTLDGTTTDTQDPTLFGSKGGGQRGTIASLAFRSAGIQPMVVSVMQAGFERRDTFFLNPKMEFLDSRDGASYPYVQLGGKRWMATELRFDTLGAKKTSDSLYAVHGTAEGAIVYPSRLAFADPQAAGAGARGPRGVCPEGWRLPTRMDFDSLLSEAARHSLPVDRMFRTRDLWDAGFAGSNQSGLSVRPTGAFNSTEAWFDTPLFWAGNRVGDMGNYMSFREPGTTSFLPTFENMDLTAGSRLPIRCISDIP